LSLSYIYISLSIFDLGNIFIPGGASPYIDNIFHFADNASPVIFVIYRVDEIAILCDENQQLISPTVPITRDHFHGFVPFQESHQRQSQHNP